MPLTKINFSTAAAQTINTELSETTDIENSKFLVADTGGTKYATLANITSGVLTGGHITTDVSAIRSEITNLQSRLDTANDGITNLNSQVSTINRDLADANSDINTISTALYGPSFMYFDETDNVWDCLNGGVTEESKQLVASNSAAKNIKEIKENISGISTNLNTLQTNLNTHKSAAATASAYGHVKLGTGLGVPNDAGMVGTCSNGGLAVRKASTDPTSGVGCVRIASSIKDTDTVSVPNAALVNASINAGADVAINGSDLRLLPADATPSDGEYQAFYIPYNLLPSWQIECITIPSLLNVQTTPLYMAAYAVSPSDAISLISVSSNALTWDVNSERTWHFETPLSVPSGYGLRIFFIDNVDNAADTSCTAISGHIKSHYIPSGSCKIRYSGVWYGGRTVDIIFSTKGHADILSTSTTAGHVYLAESETDARANAVPTIAQFKALLDRVAALETALASVTLVTAPETTTT